MDNIQSNPKMNPNLKILWLYKLFNIVFKVTFCVFEAIINIRVAKAGIIAKNYVDKFNDFAAIKVITSKLIPIKIRIIIETKDPAIGPIFEIQ